MINLIRTKAEINFMPLQPGDVVASHADVEGLVEDFDYQPKTKVEEGVDKFIEWYRSYYKV